jgi:hypothetical protein
VPRIALGAELMNAFKALIENPVTMLVSSAVTAHRRLEGYFFCTTRRSSNESCSTSTSALSAFIKP